MRNGVYTVDFKSQIGWSGLGIAVLHNGHIRGGDDEFFYVGTYISKDGAFEAVIDVHRHRGQTESIFGELEAFRLSLTGNQMGSSFVALGSLASELGLTMSAQGELLESFIGNHDGPPTSGANTPFQYSDPQLLRSLESDAFEVLRSGQTWLDMQQVSQLRKAQEDLYCGHHFAALCQIFPLLEAVVNRMLHHAGKQPKSFPGMAGKIQYLSSQGYLPVDAGAASEVFKTRNLVLHGSINPPAECAYPLCVFALLYLGRIVAEFNPSP